MTLQLNDFKYHLPPELIAQKPSVPRDHSRLLMVDRTTRKFSHHHFYDLPSLLDEKYLIVRNNTKVLPARLFGIKATGGHVEVLLLKKLRQTLSSETWECLTKPGLKAGQTVQFAHSDLTAICEIDAGYTKEITFQQSGVAFLASIEKIGQMPLPPYIHWDADDTEQLKLLYQTTYAQVIGSVAAPTAGLHFTPELDAQLQAKGVEIATVTLHVGLGTFLPVKTQDITSHQMHSEKFELSAETADTINQAKKAGKKILAVGTTTCRVLESCSDENGVLHAQTGETSIFIYPPYRFRCVDTLLTNFHLPESTLLMLISALVSKPNTTEEFHDFQSSLVGLAYQEAIAEKYRFFSFGDAMWIK